jgi:hypothetical protein
VPWECLRELEAAVTASGRRGRRRRLQGKEKVAASAAGEGEGGGGSVGQGRQSNPTCGPVELSGWDLTKWAK